MPHKTPIKIRHFKQIIIGKILENHHLNDISLSAINKSAETADEIIGLLKKYKIEKKPKKNENY